jgi:asparagine synthase (glutamine-hydrolysing)
MCGIAGILVNGPGGRARVESVAQNMAEAQIHRGPDDHGSWLCPTAPLAFGFRRLAIFDLSPLGHQPMASASGRFTIVFNGEIYNHPELRAELEGKGIRFKSRSDTEVLLEGFEVWGVPATLARTRGMFAIGLWDAAEQCLWLARDRLGIKPLFVYRHGSTLAFSSELKSFHRIDGRQLTVDPEAALSFLATLYVPFPSCIYNEVEKVEPGTWLRVSPADLSVKRGAFWSVEACVAQGLEAPFQGSAEDAVGECARILTESVALRLRSDVPVGTFLSGGVDSASVTSIAQSIARHPVRTFTVSFDDKDFDEGPQAAEIARRLGTAHTEVRLGEADLLEGVPRMPWMFDEPFADPSQLPTSLISRVARRDVTVALSGDGGDEVFAGYVRYLRGSRVLSSVRSVPRPLRRMVAAALRSVPRGVLDGAPGDLVLRLSGVSRQHPLSGRSRRLASAFGAPDVGAAYRSLLAINPDAAELMADATERAASRPDPDVVGRLTDLRRMLFTDQRGYVQDDLLCKLDRTSMATSLEARVPLLDHKLVEFSWSLPDDVLVRDGIGKWVLRRVLERFIPRELFDRPKMGFSVPLERWLRGPLRAWAESLVSRDAVARVGLLAPDAVDRMWRDFVTGHATHALPLWAVLHLQAWAGEWNASVG